MKGSKNGLFDVAVHRVARMWSWLCEEAPEEVDWNMKARRMTEAEAAIARHESLAEIVATVNRLTDEWNASDRIDMIIRITAQREGF